jgi:hypothetical protein
MTFQCVECKEVFQGPEPLAECVLHSFIIHLKQADKAFLPSLSLRIIQTMAFYHPLQFAEWRN